MATWLFDEKDEIGFGGYGNVYRTRRENDGFVAALKQLDPRKASPLVVRRFRREIRIQAKLSHPNIVPIIGYDDESERPFFVMPLARSNLWKLMGGIKGDVARLRDVFHAVAAGVAYLHAQGIIHRDLKPENILVMMDGTIAVSDFGLSRLLERDSTTLTVVGNKIGTAGYAAPEQRGDEVDAANADVRADIYALGMLVYALWTGNLPGREAVDAKKDIDGALLYVVEKATRYDPADRYQSVEEMLEAFDLATDPPNDLKHPADAIDDLFSAPPTSELADELLRVLQSEDSDGTVRSEKLPNMPEAHLRYLAAHHPRALVRMLAEYDRFQDGNLDFSYCDVVANFYRRIWSLTTDVPARVTILARLLDLGWSHNRWRCQRVFASLLVEVRDPALGLAARDVLRANPAAVLHIQGDLAGLTLAPILRKTVSELTAGVKANPNAPSW